VETNFPEFADYLEAPQDRFLADLIEISSKDFFVNHFEDECRTYPSSPRKKIAK
jgi:hypothetical protein